MNENNIIHYCVYCGKPANYQFKNGKWCCSPHMNGCEEIKRLRSLSAKHQHNPNKFSYTPKTKTVSKYKIDDNLYKCECGREFNNYRSLNAHFSHCDIHNKALNKKSKRVVRSGDACNFSKAWLGEEEFFKLRTKCSKTLKAKYASGELVHNWKNRKHSDESKQKTRNSTIKYLERTLTQPRRYNINSIKVLDKISKDNNWNLQHAENGGEVKLDIGYYLDAYDKDLNIVVEYDEPAHYKDVYNNILKDKDIYRMNLIIKHLNCEFYRYNEKTGQLIKYS